MTTNVTAEPTPQVSTNAENALADELVRLVAGRLYEHRTIWGTYRLQFTAAQFRFADARAIADYLGQLGVSHVYSSPCLKTRAGSTHGYDVVDYGRLNDELGSEAEYDAYVAALNANGLRQILDIVPNHMYVGGDANGWWMDVLTNGPASPYADYFDIDWHPIKQDLANRVLLPVLDDFYGNVLEAGRLIVRYRDGAFFVECNGALLPLDPRSWSRILVRTLAALTTLLGAEAEPLIEVQSILTALQNLPTRTETAPERVVERHRERIVIQNRLRRIVGETPKIAEQLDRYLSVLNGAIGDPRSFDELNRLLDDQAFRLVHWKAGSDELNYRRFFDVTELAAVCTENVDVFEATHRRIFELLAHHKIDALRIDHVDGLFDPAQYLWRLQWGYLRELGKEAHVRMVADGTFATDEAVPPWSALEPWFFARLHATVGGPDPASLFLRTSTARVADSAATAKPQAARNRLPLFVEVEKILESGEPLPTEWPVAGTTGYDFMNLVGGLFVDAHGYHELERHYRRFVDLHDEFRELVYECKRVVLDGAMQSEVQLLAHRLERLSARHRRSRDFTLLALRSALREIMACFTVYRSYIRDGEVSERDRTIVHLAVAQARRLNPATDASVYSFIRDVLLLTQPPELDAEGLAERDFFVGRFQQVTSPVMAKGIEDTLFYRYLPLTSVDEVGSDPLHAVTSVEEFHRQNEARLRQWPETMLATTTHDTKRTEDVRARIGILSEIPRRWNAVLRKWTRENRKHLSEVDGRSAPSRNDEWLFYQTLVGVWPLMPPTDIDRRQLIERLQNYMKKATHEAKLRTSWISPNAAYDEAVRSFVAAVVEDASSPFLIEFQDFHNSIVRAGLYSAVSQILLKFTCPGVPDVYQGQELWDFSLVDPDNRRPVDFEDRRRRLADMIRMTSTPAGQLELARRLALQPQDPCLKLFVTRTALEFRRAWTDLLDAGRYIPLAVEGEIAMHVCAFAWQIDRPGELPRSAVVVAPRLLQGLLGGTDGPPCGVQVWKDTAIIFPESFPKLTLRDRFTGKQVEISKGKSSVATLLNEFPVALLTN